MKILLTIFLLAPLVTAIRVVNPRQPDGKEVPVQPLAISQHAEPLADTSYPVGALSHSGVEAKNMPATSLVFRVAEPHGNKVAELYVIKVVEANSQTPVVNARVRVVIAGPPTVKREGRTDASGLYVFHWQPFKKNIRAHISVQAEGFVNLDDDSVLSQDRVVQLDRTKGTTLSCVETTSGDWRDEWVVRFSNDRIGVIVTRCSPQLLFRPGYVHSSRSSFESDRRRTE